MGTFREPPDPPYIEPVPIEQEFASGPALVETIGDITYLVFYVDQLQPPELNCRRERRICHRIIIPNAGAHRLARMLQDKLTQGVQGPALAGAF